MRKETSSRQGQFQESTVPYWFSSAARRRQENILIGDYVLVSGLEDRKFELMEVFPQFGSVRVREVGHVDCLLFPRSAVSPWRRTKVMTSTSLTQALGDALYQGSLVYWLDQPNRGVLRVKTINWRRETSDLQDSQGQVCHDIPWDNIEFAVETG